MSDSPASQNIASKNPSRGDDAQVQCDSDNHQKEPAGDLASPPQSRVSQALLDAWYGKRRWVLALAPVALIYGLLTGLRRLYLVWLRQVKLPVPVVVVGNISLGGTGKTPFLISLIAQLRAAGWRPGVVSRGYGGHPPHLPYLLDETSGAADSGDEPLSIYQRTGAPVCVDRDRVAAARRLVNEGCDIILSDDGLQHYRLGRDLELVLIDGVRGLGNGYLLPMGPLRECPRRLRGVDGVILNSPSAAQTQAFADLNPTEMRIAPTRLVQITTGASVPMSLLQAPLAGMAWQAVAGIGNPARFAMTLATLGCHAPLIDFPDHHAFTPADFDFAENAPVVMTEKDAVKCRAFARDNWYYLEVNATCPEAFWQSLLARLARLK